MNHSDPVAEFNLELLDVAAPCHANWADMTGDDRTRLCGQCDQHVYNLSEMTRAEAEALVLEAEGRRCVRFFRRYDGTVVTSDCPVGVRALRQRLLKATIALASIVAVLVLTPLYVLGAPIRGWKSPLGTVGAWRQPQLKSTARNVGGAQPLAPVMGNMMMGKVAAPVACTPPKK